MARDRSRPLLRLRETRAVRRTAPGRRARFPPELEFARQQRVIAPKFDRLERAFEQGREAVIELQDDPSALAPDTLVVFEVQASLVTFAEAVNAIPGLELVSEEDGDITDEENEVLDGHYAPDFGDMGDCGSARQFVFRPLSLRAIGPVRQRRRRPVCHLHPARWGSSICIFARIFLSQKIVDVRFRAMACCYGNEPGTAAVQLGMKLRLGHFKNMRPESVHFRPSGCRG